MLALAAERLCDCGLGTTGTEFVQADALVWNSPPHAFDLIPGLVAGFYES
jgi:hypothetical protein